MDECAGHAENQIIPSKMQGQKAKDTCSFAKNGQRPARAADIVVAPAADGLTSQPTTSKVIADTDCTQGESNSGERHPGLSADLRRGPQGETLASDAGTSDAIGKDPPHAETTNLISELCHVITSQHEKIQRLRLQLDYVMSFLGITDTCEEGTKDAIQSTPDDAAGLLAPYDGDGHELWSKFISKRQCQPQRRIDNFQHSVVAAVYVDESLKSRRESSLIVAGLEPTAGVSDAELFASVCLAEFALKPNIVYTKRLGHSQVGRTQPLLVYMK
jgi:uncharacterized coiled-coil protein SlyX